MKWLEEILGKIEFDGEGAEQARAEIMKALKGGIAQNFVPKNDFNDRTNEYNALKEQYDTEIAARDTQIKELTESSGNAEEFKAKLEEAQQQNQQFKTEYDQKLADVESARVNDRKQFGLTSKLKDAGFGQEAIDLIMPKANLENITLNDKGDFVGMDDVATSLTESYGQFRTNTTTVTGAGPTKEGDTPKPPKNEAEMSDAEFFASRQSGSK